MGWFCGCACKYILIDATDLHETVATIQDSHSYKSECPEFLDDELFIEVEEDF